MEVAEGRLGFGVDAPRVVLAKPLTYMNVSGGPVAALCDVFGRRIPRFGDPGAHLNRLT